MSSSVSRNSTAGYATYRLYAREGGPARITIVGRPFRAGIAPR